jgi:hypothetical protein
VRPSRVLIGQHAKRPGARHHECVEAEVITHQDVTTFTVLMGDIRNDLRFFRSLFEKGDDDGEGPADDEPREPPPDR